MTIASIDIGTNTILMLIAKIKDNQLITLANEYSIPRIGKNVSPGKDISDEKISELISILKSFKQKATELNVDNIICTGTNALRIAANSQAVCKRVFAETGISIDVISGEKEAIYTFLGATGGPSEIRNLVIDIGGGSTEIVSGDKEILYKKSFQAGVVTGTEKFFLNDPPGTEQIDYFLRYLDSTFHELPSSLKNPQSCIAIAGTPTTLACIKNNLEVYNEEIIEGSYLSKAEIDNLVIELSGISSKDILMKYKFVTSGRQDVLLSGTIILQYLMNRLNISKIKVSTKGIRYGAVYYNYFSGMNITD